MSTLVAHFTLSYNSVNIYDAFPNLNPFKGIYGREELLTSLHKRVECALEKLLSTVLSGFKSTRSDFQKYLVHSMIAC